MLGKFWFWTPPESFLVVQYIRSTDEQNKDPGFCFKVQLNAK